MQINVSRGGVPKRPVESAEVTALGLTGDDHHDRRHHGGPDRALCLFSLEVIRRLQAEGHPITPGSTGENLTLEGLPWEDLVPGVRLRFDGGVEVEVASYTTPCSTIRASFLDGQITRIKQALHPGSSRVYARVLTPGRLSRGEGCRLAAPDAGAA